MEGEEVIIGNWQISSINWLEGGGGQAGAEKARGWGGVEDGGDGENERDI